MSRHSRSALEQPQVAAMPSKYIFACILLLGTAGVALAQGERSIVQHADCRRLRSRVSNTEFPPGGTEFAFASLRRKQILYHFVSFHSTDLAHG